MGRLQFQINPIEIKLTTAFHIASCPSGAMTRNNLIKKCSDVHICCGMQCFDGSYFHLCPVLGQNIIVVVSSSSDKLIIL